MNAIATTKMTSRGQVVIPEEIRKRLNLVTGVQFLMLEERNGLFLKPIKPDVNRSLSELLAEARKQAAETGMTPEDIENAIREVRGR